MQGSRGGEPSTWPSSSRVDIVAADRQKQLLGRRGESCLLAIDGLRSLKEMLDTECFSVTGDGTIAAVEVAGRPVVHFSCGDLVTIFTPQRCSHAAHGSASMYKVSDLGPMQTGYEPPRKH